MNDIADNKYIKTRMQNFAAYSLQDFLYREISVERRTDINDIMLAINDILVLHGFDIHLLGFKFLASMTARYIIQHDYEPNSAIAKIAYNYGTSEEYVCSCIKASINYNPDFKRKASKTLGLLIDSYQKINATDAVEILGAIFKIFYNYKVDDENFEHDKQFVINFNRL